MPADLVEVLSSPLLINGVTTGAGRMFGVSQGDARSDAPGSPQLVEIVGGVPRAYPDESWSQPGDGAAERFVGVNSVRVGPDGTLWAVDRGTTGVGEPRVPGGPRLLGFDLATDTLGREYDLESATRPWSFVDDVRFHERHAYLTDCGAPALIVLDLETGTARRVLEGHPAAVAQQPLRAEHRALAHPDGRPVSIHLDQLEVSPDGRWLYLQPCCGGMSRIPTAVLDDETATEQQLADAVETFAATPSTGGTAIDGDGTIYLSDVDESRILAISPTGDVRVLLDDVRLSWVDAMWIDDDGRLLMPAAQLNRTAGLNWGIDTVVPPLTVWSFATGRPPFRA